MALYTVEAGDNIWNIADRSLGLQRGTNTPPASVQEVADEMLRIITLNMGKLKVPKGRKGTPGPADLIHAGLVLDLGGAPSPTDAITNGKTQKPPTDLEREKTPGAKPPTTDTKPSPGRDSNGNIVPSIPMSYPEGNGRGVPPPVRPYTPGPPMGPFAVGDPRLPPAPDRSQREIRPVSPRPNSAPTGGREPGWGGRDNSQREVRPVSPQRSSAPTGGREPGWGGRSSNSAPTGGREPGWGGRSSNSAPTGGREPGWGGRSSNSAPTGGREPGWGGRLPQREVRPVSPSRRGTPPGALGMPRLGGK